MNVTILGTGTMGRAIATRALAGGARVEFVGTALAKAEDLLDEFEGLGEVSASEVVTGDVAVLAVPYTEATHVVRQHEGELAGKVIVDPTNPIDLATLEPLTDVDGSGAQTIAAAAPVGAVVVKAFNTVLAGTLVAGEVAGQPLDVFLASDDDAAKEKVAELARKGGLRPLDAGPLRRARELEGLAVVHMNVQDQFGMSFATAVKVLSP
jgi:predicted dinucleotide-binding enzyme